jgi:hypothetical protein
MIHHYTGCTTVECDGCRRELDVVNYPTTVQEAPQFCSIDCEAAYWRRRDEHAGRIANELLTFALHQRGPDHYRNLEKQ